MHRCFGQRGQQQFQQLHPCYLWVMGPVSQPTQSSQQLWIWGKSATCSAGVSTPRICHCDDVHGPSWATQALGQQGICLMHLSPLYMSIIRNPLPKKVPQEVWVDIGEAQSGQGPGILIQGLLPHLFRQLGSFRIATSCLLFSYSWRVKELASFANSS